MDFVKPQESIEPPVNTGAEGQSPDTDVASTPSPEIESAAVSDYCFNASLVTSIDEINKPARPADWFDRPVTLPPGRDALMVGSLSPMLITYVKA